MSNFDLAIPIVFKNEGGFVDDTSDSGGATNFGISLNFLKTIDPNASVVTIKNMSREQASFIYRKEFWDKGNYGELDNQALANKVFDMSVNMGVTRANRLLQMAVNDEGFTLTIDGILGPKTIGTLNDSWSLEQDAILKSFKLRCIEFYNSLAQQNPTKLKFLCGWINRALS